MQNKWVIRYILCHLLTHSLHILVFPQQMKMSVRPPQCVALPPATTHWAASSVCVPLALTSSRALVAARMWMNAAREATPASTAAPIPTEATCVAVLEASTEPDRGEGPAIKHILINWCHSTFFELIQVAPSDHKTHFTELCSWIWNECPSLLINMLHPLVVYIQSLHDGLRFPEPGGGGRWWP